MDQDPRGLRTPNDAGQAAAQEQIQRLASAYTRLFATEDGKTVLNDLVMNFENRQLLADAHVMPYMAGQRDVSLYVRQQIAMGQSAGAGIEEVEA